MKNKPNKVILVEFQQLPVKSGVTSMWHFSPFSRCVKSADVKKFKNSNSIDEFCFEKRKIKAIKDASIKLEEDIFIETKDKFTIIDENHDIWHTTNVWRLAKVLDKNIDLLKKSSIK